MNKKGQALVEFIIVVPILVFILFAIIDYGMMSYNRNKLENIIGDISKMISNQESDEEIKKFIKYNDNNIKYEFYNEGKYYNVVLIKEYDYITPGLNKILNNHEIKVERKMYNE